MQPLVRGDGQWATVSALVTVGFPRDDEPTVDSQDELIRTVTSD
ncbi:MAG: hypothetical protein WAO35_10875 [Terriglobia bacterium]